MILPKISSTQLSVETPAALRQAGELLQQLQLSLEEVDKSFFVLSYGAPTRPRDGMVRFADGTSWDPGYGKGLYQYMDGIWTPLRTSPALEITVAYA